MDTGKFGQELTVETAHIVYKLAHHWNYQDMEVDASKFVIPSATWEMLYDLKHRNNSRFVEAVKLYMNNPKTTPPEVIATVVEEYRVVKANRDHLRTDYKQLRVENGKTSSELTFATTKLHTVKLELRRLHTLMATALNSSTYNLESKITPVADQLAILRDSIS
jgi:hypothetical protein